MPKDQHTPREELVCGKLEKLASIILRNPCPDAARMMDLVESIAHDCQRMEAKLASRKDEVQELEEEVENLEYYIRRSSQD